MVMSLSVCNDAIAKSFYLIWISNFILFFSHEIWDNTLLCVCLFFYSSYSCSIKLSYIFHRFHLSHRFCFLFYEIYVFRSSVCVCFFTFGCCCYVKCWNMNRFEPEHKSANVYANFFYWIFRWLFSPSSSSSLVLIAVIFIYEIHTHEQKVETHLVTKQLFY